MVSPTTGNSENVLAEADNAEGLSAKILGGIHQTYGKRRVDVVPNNLAGGNEAIELSFDNYLGQAKFRFEPLTEAEYSTTTIPLR